MSESLERRRLDASNAGEVPPIHGNVLDGHGKLIRICLDRRPNLSQSIQELTQAVRGLTIAGLRKQQLLNHPP